MTTGREAWDVIVAVDDTRYDSQKKSLPVATFYKFISSRSGYRRRCSKCTTMLDALPPSTSSTSDSNSRNVCFPYRKHTEMRSQIVENRHTLYKRTRLRAWPFCVCVWEASFAIQVERCAGNVLSSRDLRLLPSSDRSVQNGSLVRLGVVICVII